MEGYRYEANDKGQVVPKITTSDELGLVQRCARAMVQEVEKVRAMPGKRVSLSV
jgi:hypothetical protein